MFRAHHKQLCISSTLANPENLFSSMLPATTIFIPTRLFIQSPVTFLPQTSFVPLRLALSPKHAHLPLSALPIPSRFPTPRRPRTTPHMRKSRNSPSSPSPIPSKPLEKLIENASSIWRNASTAQRLTVGTAALAFVAFLGAVLNTLFHVSLFLAFSTVPLLLIPLMFAFLASFTAFAFLTFATAGLGAFLVGTPLFAVSLMAKAFFPVIFVTAGAALLMRHLLALKKSDKPEEPPEFFQDVDDMERFDRILRNRQTPKNLDVSRWNINDVIDELDYAGLGGYRQLFIDERIDGPALLELTYEEIRTEFGKSMPLGDRMRLTRLVTLLRKQSNKLQ